MIRGIPQMVGFTWFHTRKFQSFTLGMSYIYILHYTQCCLIGLSSYLSHLWDIPSISDLYHIISPFLLVKSPSLLDNHNISESLKHEIDFSNGHKWISNFPDLFHILSGSTISISTMILVLLNQPLLQL